MSIGDCLQMAGWLATGFGPALLPTTEIRGLSLYSKAMQDHRHWSAIALTVCFGGVAMLLIGVMLPP